jgi:DNA-binding transcriptional ArsR family regulator
MDGAPGAKDDLRLLRKRREMDGAPGLVALGKRESQYGAVNSDRVADFDRLAGIYRWMELFTFGPWLERCRCAFLSEMREASKGLVLGDGDGRFTARLLGTNTTIEIEAVDASDRMLRELRRRAGEHVARVRTHCADAREWEPAGGGYDLVVSHFFLDCLTTDEVRELADRVRRSVSAEAAWVVSDFAVPDGWLGRLVARPLVWGLFCAFGLLTGLRVRTLPNHRDALRDAGFKLAQQRRSLGGILVSELWRVEEGKSCCNRA